MSALFIHALISPITVPSNGNHIFGSSVESGDLTWLMANMKSFRAGHSYRLNIVFLVKAHKTLSNIGVSHLFVDIIPMQWYTDMLIR